MTKTEAIVRAAREVIAYGGPDCLTDPHVTLPALNDVMTRGVTEDEILAAVITRENELEDAGMHADDRITCHAHQGWAVECADYRMHTNPSAFN
ncbi:hypothetical protein ACH4E7_06895 [Kitasatospora sp. NPDC018058]|uniref:hypothetical protein n=1 Tax=Kitasatospora sp. NPDC018058 TaxID=3364025 RepID=UPI0037BE9C17